MRTARINEIARIVKAKTYLEIGVFHGETFFEVNIENKIAVDPKFQFGPERRVGDGSFFIEKSSDEYFYLLNTKSSEAGPLTIFDVIYLDGLHTYEQTMRDFLNSLAVSHSKTVWLIDDTVPNDVFSALPDQELCYRLRAVMGNGDPAWMGDVFKLVYFIRRMMPGFRVKTFTGHGQTAIWREAVEPLVNWATTLEKVPNLSYPEFFETFNQILDVSKDEEIYCAIEKSYNAN